MAETATIYSVKDINTYIKDIIENIPPLQDIWIQGEVSNLKSYHLGKQTYFNLNDNGAQINCVSYNNTMNLKNGHTIYARGKVIVFQKQGRILFQVNYHTTKGPGPNSTDYQRLKEKCQKEGLFDPQNKAPLPQYPSTIGLITAWQSAAMWDCVSLINQKAPHIQIRVFPATMQGPTCSNTVQKALQLAIKDKSCDTLIITRGGGSAEDLSGFNHEDLIRQIASCPVPIITAIGHETDVTLSDFVSDHRAPTPSAAVLTLLEPLYTLKRHVRETLETQRDTLLNSIDETRSQIKNRLQTTQITLKNKQKTIQKHTNHLLERLESANPLHRLKQGYSICRIQKNGKILHSVRHIKVQDLIEISQHDGQIISEVKEIKKKNETKKGL